MADHPADVSAAFAGARGRCPRCGQGRLFNGYIATAPACEVCGLDFKFADSGDGASVFVILIVGFIVVGAALITEVKYQPPYWLHLALWLPLLLALSLGLLRPFKGILIGLQFQNRAREGRLEDPDA